jgi:hypothetical protein
MNGVRRAFMGRLVRRAAGPLRLQFPELLLVRLPELLAEQAAKGRFGVFGHFTRSFAIQIPVSRLHGHERERALAQLAVERFLQVIRIEFGQHALEGHADAGQHRELMIAKIGERVGEGVDRAQICGVSLHEEVVQRVFDVDGELQRVVFGRAEERRIHPELLLDVLPRLEDVHQAGDHDSKDFSETSRQILRYGGTWHPGTGQELGKLLHSAGVARRRTVAWGRRRRQRGRLGCRPGRGDRRPCRLGNRRDLGRGRRRRVSTGRRGFDAGSRANRRGRHELDLGGVGREWIVSLGNGRRSRLGRLGAGNDARRLEVRGQQVIDRRHGRLWSSRRGPTCHGLEELQRVHFVADAGVCKSPNARVRRLRPRREGIVFGGRDEEIDERLTSGRP